MNMLRSIGTAAALHGRSLQTGRLAVVAPARLYSSKVDLGPREADDVDLAIVGAGPAGLAAAIRFKQLDAEHGSGDLRVVVLEKASDLGAHTLSGAVLEPRALDELLPDWRDAPPAYATLVTEDRMRFLTEKSSFWLPEPPQMHNRGKNYIVSLNQVVKWLGEKAEELGVEIYPGFSVSELVYDEAKQRVRGVATNDMGLDKNYEPRDNFERGMEFHAKATLLAEGCHGSLSKGVISKFQLRDGKDPQTYGLGIKEVWEVQPEKFQKGLVAHAMGFPLGTHTYGGSFMYHFGDNYVSLGLVTGLDYKNPYISPYQEFQRMKHHPFFAETLKGGSCISYGARALNEGGLQSIPKLTFPGGALIGCSAGFMNVPKIKGTHTAMKSGMLAAETVFKGVSEGAESVDMAPYETALKNSWVWSELSEVRNVRPSFNLPGGFVTGLVVSGFETMVAKGKLPYTLHHKHTDAQATEPADKYKPIQYAKPDGELSFDLLTSVSRTGTMHDEDEPCHLRVPGQNLQEHALKSWPVYKGIEQRFCPAGVYEYIEDPSSDLGVKFQINSQNCIHCKTCDIKVPTQDINWTVPEGGDGPKYYLT